MHRSIADADPADNEDLHLLRRMIVQLAERCGLDLEDSSAIRRFLDGDFSPIKGHDCDTRSCDDLKAMITLLFRLEASTSEDLGISGLRRLWHRHSEILTSSTVRNELQGYVTQRRLAPA